MPQARSREFPKEIAAILARGGIGVIPTDTIYGVVGKALSKKTVARIYALKRRNPKKPFIILIAGYGDLAKFGVRLTGPQKKFLRTQWPIRSIRPAQDRRAKGRPVSVILPAPQKKFAYLHRGTASLAFRMPRVASLLRLLRSTGPLVAPSANPEGEAPAATIEEAVAYFGTKADFYVDDGKRKGKPSRLVDMTSGHTVVLRR